ncbi:MAG: CsgG/HfaB family protein [Kiritimatiellae bacterium]|jgi:TolB-like protein|nr:CsgG/HfaB family protein [Kiritimatiellia bacterium]MDY0148891.1 CsgG/HfaB family protein [Kiritimatiellia bacterium]
MKKVLWICLIASLTIGSAWVSPAEAQDGLAVYPTAIFPFHERGEGVKGYGNTASDILFASLVVNPDLLLVDREEINKTLQEQEMNLSGMVSPGDAVQVGSLIGAKVLITGSVIDADQSIYLVARIIGTETSRVLGESVKGKSSDAIGDLVEQLAEKVGATIAARASELVAPVKKPEERIAAVNAELGDKPRPVLMVSIAENHVGRATIDPAAETEFTLMARETGFEVVDPQAGSSKQADIIIRGEGFSEFAMRRGNMVSVKARLEVKAVDRATDRVIATDRQTVVVVDLSEEIAGKSALQDAAAQIAERMLPKLVD